MKQSSKHICFLRRSLILWLEMLFAIVACVFLLMSAHSEAFSDHCNNYFACSVSHSYTCYWGSDCRCPDGYKYYPLCEPQFSCTGNCTKDTEKYVVCIPKDYCTAEESVLGFHICGYRTSVKCEYRIAQHWLIRYRRYYVYIILVLITFYVLLKCVIFECRRKPKQQPTNGVVSLNQ